MAAKTCMCDILDILRSDLLDKTEFLAPKIRISIIEIRGQNQ